MKVTIYSDDRVTHNGTVLTDVIWADAEAGEAEVYEHTCSTLHGPEHIPDADNPLGYRTMVLKGKIQVENVRAATAPAQGSFDYGAGSGSGPDYCYNCAMAGYVGCFCSHRPL